MEMHSNTHTDMFAFINPLSRSPLQLDLNMRDERKTCEANMQSQLKGKFQYVQVFSMSFSELNSPV